LLSVDADGAEAQLLVERPAAGVERKSGQHELVEAVRPGELDQRFEHRAPHAPAAPGPLDVDREVGDEPVGLPRVEDVEAPPADHCNGVRGAGALRGWPDKGAARPRFTSALTPGVRGAGAFRGWPDKGAPWPRFTSALTPGVRGAGAFRGWLDKGAPRLRFPSAVPANEARLRRFGHDHRVARAPVREPPAALLRRAQLGLERGDSVLDALVVDAADHVDVGRRRGPHAVGGHWSGVRETGAIEGGLRQGRG